MKDISFVPEPSRETVERLLSEQKTERARQTALDFVVWAWERYKVSPQTAVQLWRDRHTVAETQEELQGHVKAREFEAIYGLGLDTGIEVSLRAAAQLQGKFSKLRTDLGV